MLTGVRVLIVEDEPLVALDLEATFKDAGASVVCALSFVHAIDVIQRNLIDFAVLDTNLWQGQTSYPISDMLRAAAIPFAVFSAYSAPHQGAMAHVKKPFTSDQVVAVAERYLQMRKP